MNLSKTHLAKLQEVCEEISARTHCDISVMGLCGTILASSLPERIGKVHKGAAQVVAGDVDGFDVTAEMAEQSHVMLEGCNRGIDVEGERVASIGIAAPLDMAQTYATITQICFQSLFESFGSKEHLENVLKAASMVSIIAIDVDGTINTFNHGAERMLGYEAEEVVGKHTPDLFHLESETIARKEELEKKYQRKLTNLDAYIYAPLQDGYEEREWTYVRKDGSHLSANLGVSSILDEKGELVGFLGVAKDISKRKKAEKELALHRAHLQQLVAERTADLVESETRFRTFAESMSDWLWEMDEDLRFSYFTEGFDEHIGVSSRSILGKKREDLIDEAIPDEVFRHHLDDINNHREFSNFTYPYRHPDGGIVYIQVSGTPILDEDGAFKGYRGTGSNVTKEVAAEKALGESERRFKDIAETASDWFWETDRDHKFTFISDRFFEVSNSKPEDVLGRSRLGMLTEERMKRDPEKWKKHKDDLENSRAFELQYWFENEKGYRTCIEIKGKPVFNELGDFEGYRGAGTDVTEAVELQEGLKRAKDIAEKANKAKSEFLSNMSHELRTPLNAILGFAQILEQDRSDPLSERQIRNVGQIKSGGEHLLKLINEILDLTRIEAGKMSLSLEVFNLRDLLSDCLTLSRTIATSRQVRLIDEAGSELSAVYADHLRTKQVILNLLSNAIKYNHENGRVWIYADQQANGMIRISIKDNGPGIPPEKQVFLFQPFQRLGAETLDIEGTGIGLVLTKKLVEEMGGDIGYESMPGAGSTFWVHIPCAEQDQVLEFKEKGPEEKPDRPVASQRNLILYVEDNPSNVVLMSNIIEDIEGMTMISAKTAEEGIEIARLKQPNAIILDINLPGMNGVEAVKVLKTLPETKDIEVIALSADAMPRTIEEGMAAGFKHYLTKPLDIPKFLEVLQDTLT